MSDEITSRDEAKGVKKPKTKLMKRQKKRLKEKDTEMNANYVYQVEEENYSTRVCSNGGGLSTTCTVRGVRSTSKAELDDESETECLNEYCSAGDFFAVSARTVSIM